MIRAKIYRAIDSSHSEVLISRHMELGLLTTISLINQTLTTTRVMSVSSTSSKIPRDGLLIVIASYSSTVSGITGRNTAR